MGGKWISIVDLTPYAVRLRKDENSFLVHLGKISDILIPNIQGKLRFRLVSAGETYASVNCTRVV